MKVIQTLYDIEFLKATNTVPIEIVKEIEQDFVYIYEAENVDEDVYLLNYRLSPWKALCVFEKGDNVLKKLDDLMSLEFVENIKLGEFAYYRCALRNDHNIQIYYSPINIHDKETEDWLREQAEWNEGIGDFNVRTK